MIRVLHPGSGSWFLSIPDPKVKKPRIRIRNTGFAPKDIRYYFQLACNSQVNVWYIKIFVDVGVPWHLCWLDPHQRHGCGQDQGEHRGGNSRQVHQVSNRIVVISFGEVADPLILLRKMFQLRVGRIWSGPYFKFPLVRKNRKLTS